MVLPRAVALVLVSLCATGNVVAQSIPAPLPSRPIAAVVDLPDGLSPAERLAALQRWVTQFTDWRDWFTHWENRSEPGWLSTRERRPLPPPPSWLAGMCSPVLAEGGPVTDACHLWNDWIREGKVVGILDQQQASARASTERPSHSLWWEHVHLDAFWPMTQVGSKAFGVAGVHVTMELAKRVGVFVAPGVILMRAPSADGSSAWTPAADWGFSYRMFDLRVPGMRRRGSAHFNIARVWLLGTSAQPIQGAVYLAGFSLTFHQR